MHEIRTRTLSEARTSPENIPRIRADPVTSDVHLIMLTATNSFLARHPDEIRYALMCTRTAHQNQALNQLNVLVLRLSDSVGDISFEKGQNVAISGQAQDAVLDLICNFFDFAPQSNSDG